MTILGFYDAFCFRTLTVRNTFVFHLKKERRRRQDAHNAAGELSIICSAAGNKGDNSAHQIQPNERRGQKRVTVVKQRQLHPRVCSNQAAAFKKSVSITNEILLFSRPWLPRSSVCCQDFFSPFSGQSGRVLSALEKDQTREGPRCPCKGLDAESPAPVQYRPELEAARRKKQMAKQGSLSGRRFAAVLFSVAAVTGVLCFLALGSTHAHHDFKGHKDCSVCLWQSFFFSLTHKGIAPTYIAAVAFLVCARLRLGLPSRVIRQAPIRAPPGLQD